MGRITGAIDSIRKLGEDVVLGGWAAYIEADGTRTPVEDIRVGGLEAVSLSRHPRPDLGGDNELGFNLRLAGIDWLFELRSGHLSCAVRAGTQTQTLALWSKLGPQVNALLLEETLSGLDAPARRAFVGRLVAQMGDGGDSESNAAHTGSSGASELVGEVGLTSFDGSTVVGRNGFLFLKGGTNSVESQYAAETTLPPSVARWAALVRGRAACCAERGAAFRQLIIPEKQSVLGEFYPTPVDRPTPQLMALEGALENFLPMYLPLAEGMRALHKGEGISPYRRVDSHFSYFGALHVVRCVLTSLAANDVLPPTPDLEERSLGGDLGSKFGFGSLLERVLMPDPGWEFTRRAPTVVESYRPEQGHTGTTMRWRAAAPLIDQRLVVFGNSFFERGASPTGLSWWFSRIFREVTFVWSAPVDFSRVDRERPDIVIAQTIERFLGSVPAS